ncbi:unnamed protein product [Rotaria sordida]|uniref:Uncharacterized protein n=1 Tax=Rotaria sordida TaxID=392033 RepID=A0A814IAB5_9BILA|nr:unnamed protein product [Rotaria sordida]CAF1179896.1 unnamed protein product [Rotaria sordida]
MFIDDLPALQDWLVTTLELLCDSEPIGLANDIIRLVTEDKTLNIIRENCVRRLENIFNESTVNFVDQLFDNIQNGQYISETEKENIPPKPMKNTTKIFEQQENNHETQLISKSTTSPFTTINRSIKRRYSSISENNSSSTKRTQYSYSHLSTDSVSLSSTHIISKIEILRVYDIKSTYIKNILDCLMDLPELYSLTINVIDNIDDVNIFYIKIFGLSKLTFCQVEYKTIPTKTNRNYLVIDETIFSPLQQLIINADFPTNSLDILFSYLPQIRRLSIDRLTPSTTKQIKPIIMPYLKHVTLKLNNIKFNEFEQIMKNFFENIQILSINTNNDQDYIQATKWEQLIINHIPDLNIFSLYYDGIDNTTSIHNHFQLNELIENFNSSFWIERKWFFNYQYVDEESSDGGIVYTIDPYRKHYHTYQPANQLELDMNLNAVKHVHIWKKQMSINHLNNFRNANTLTLGHDINYISFEILNHVVCFKKLNHLYIKSIYFCFENILELLHYAPNISSINIQAIFVCNRTYNTIQNTEYYNDLLNNNHVKSFTTRDNCDFYTINMILSLFNKINYLKLNINVQQIQQIADHLIDCINSKKKKNY